MSASPCRQEFAHPQARFLHEKRYSLPLRLRRRVQCVFGAVNRATFKAIDGAMFVGTVRACSGCAWSCGAPLTGGAGMPVQALHCCADIVAAPPFAGRHPEQVQEGHPPCAVAVHHPALPQAFGEWRTSDTQPNEAAAW